MYTNIKIHAGHRYTDMYDEEQTRFRVLTLLSASAQVSMLFWTPRQLAGSPKGHGGPAGLHLKEEKEDLQSNWEKA